MRRRMTSAGARAAIFWAVFSALPATAVAQQRLWRVDGERREDSLGADVAAVADVDGDGVPEVFSGMPSTTGATMPSGARLSSGRTGATLREWSYADGNDHLFGGSVAALDDVDGDGLADLAVSAFQRPVGGTFGEVYVYSSSTGALLRTVSNPGIDGSFGERIRRGPDLDGDGRVELVITNPTASVPEVFFFSALTGGLLRVHVGSTGSLFGSAFSLVGDIDQDGAEDYVIAAPADASSPPYVGAAHLFSGATGAWIRQFNEPNDNTGPLPRLYPTSVSGLGDVDGDGTPDVLLGNAAFGTDATCGDDGEPCANLGEVVVHSGATGNALYSIIGEGRLKRLGLAVAGLDDLDGDGVNDFAVGMSHPVSIEIHSGATGATLRTSGVETQTTQMRFDAGFDFSGDGTRDLLHGNPRPYPSSTYPQLAGRVQVLSPTDATILFDQYGEDHYGLTGFASVIVDDRNGDSVPDVAVSRPSRDRQAGGVVEILSGVDGSVLGQFERGEVDMLGWALVSLGDVDGDGVRDLAAGAPLAHGDAGLVEIRSGADDSVLRILSEPLPPYFGTTMAGGLDASGASRLAVAESRWDGGTDGRLQVYDPATGAVLLSVPGPPGAGFGWSLASAGDVNQDGFLDWAVGATDRTVAVSMISGVDGSTIWVSPTPWGDSYQQQLFRLGDLDGDGAPELGGGASSGFRIWSGADGSELTTIPTPQAYSSFGASASNLGDLNRDGVEDFALGAFNYDTASLWDAGAVFVFSGANLRLLYRVDGTVRGGHLGETLMRVEDRRADASFDGDDIADLISGSPSGFDQSPQAGSVEAIRLDDLYLQIEPAVAQPGGTVRLDTRGGPAGQAAALFILDVGGVPFVRLLALASLDGNGEWSLSGSVPAGLSGFSVSFQSFAIGFTGKIVDTQVQVLTIE